MRWFGEPWPSDQFRAPICDGDVYRTDAPIGKQCTYCPAEIAAGERGVLMAGSTDIAESFMVELREPDGKLVWAQVCASHIDCLVRATVGDELARMVAPDRRPLEEPHSENLHDRLRAVLGRDLPESRACARCGRVSWHPMDVATGWCAACEDFTGDETTADLYALAANLQGEESTALFRRLDKKLAVIEQPAGHADASNQPLIEEVLRSSAVFVYSEGPVSCSVCAPSMLPVEKVADAVNQINPTRISSRWTLSTEETFSNGMSHPGPCNSSEERTHYLFHC